MDRPGTASDRFGWSRLNRARHSLGEDVDRHRHGEEEHGEARLTEAATWFGTVGLFRFGMDVFGKDRAGTGLEG